MRASIGFVAFSPDGRTALTCSDDNSARLWDAATGRPVGSPLEHVGTVVHAAFSPDGAFLVTTGWDSEAQLWDTATSLSREARFSQSSPVSRVAFNPNGHTISGCLPRRHSPDL